MKTTRQVAAAIEQLRSLLEAKYGYNYEFRISGNGEVIAASNFVRHEVFPEIEEDDAAPVEIPSSATSTSSPSAQSPDVAPDAKDQRSGRQSSAKPEMLLHGKPLYPDSVLEWRSLGEWHRVRADSHDANPSMNHLQYIKMFPKVNDEVYRWPEEKKEKQ